MLPRETLQALLAERDPTPLAQRLVERGLVPRATLQALFGSGPPTSGRPVEPSGPPPSGWSTAPGARASGRLLASTASTTAGPAPPRSPEPQPGAPVALQSAEVLCERLLGRGGMGAVYLVRDPRLGRRAALKLAQGAEHDPRRQLRFKRETLVTAQLDHPNIPPVYEAGRTPEGRDYLLMRYVGGRALSALFAEAGPGASTPLLEALVRVGEALAYAHSQGVVHRDLKPDNLMVGAFGEVLVLDWGLARLLRESAEADRSLRSELAPSGEGAAAGLTADGTFLGTLGYAAPEQVRGEDVDGRADVFGLGAILCELLTGAVPLAGETVAERIGASLTGRVDVPDAPVPPELLAIARRATAPDPAARYESAAAFAADLRAYLEGRPVAAYVYHPIEQALRVVRRHPALFSGIGVAFALTVVAVAAISGATARGAAAARREALERSRARSAAAAASFAATAERPPADRLGPALGALQAAERWGALAPDDPEAAAAVFDAALALGDVALAGEQWALAEQAYGQARGLGVDDGRAERAQGEVERRRSEEARRRELELVSLLEAARSGELAERPRGVEEAVFRVVRWPEPQTVALLAAALDEVSAELGGEVEALLRAAATPTPEEAEQGEQPLEGLAPAWTRAVREGADALSDAERGLIEQAFARLTRRDARERGGARASGKAWVQVLDERAPVDLSELAARRQARLSPGLFDAARLAAEALGWIGRAEGVEPLVRYLEVEHDPVRAAAAGAALARIGGAPAQRALLVALRRFRPRTARFANLVAAASARTAIGLEPADDSPEALLAHARDLRLLGRQDLASAALEQAVAKAPEHAAAWAELASVRIEAGQVEEGGAAAERALAIDPALAIAWCDLALVEVLRRRLPEAERAAERALTLAPKLAMAWHNRGLARLERAELAGARADFDRALELSPELGVAWANRSICRALLRDHEGALADGERAVELAPQLAVSWRARGTALRSLGRFDRARVDADRAIEVEAEDAASYVLRAELKIRAGDLDGALADCARALALAPDRPAPWLNRAAAYRLLGDYPSARDAVEQALRLVPDDPAALTHLAVLLRESGRSEEALAQLDRALARDPDLVDAHDTRGLTLIDLGRHAEAAAALERALALDPKRAYAWTSLGYARTLLGQYEEALAAHDRALALAPTLAIARSNRAVTLLRRGQEGDLERAHDEFRRAVELDPKAALLRANLAEVLRRLGRLDEARAELERAVELDPRQPIVQRQRAELALQEGELERAYRYADEALAIDPNDLQVLFVRGAAAWRAGEQEAGRRDLEAVLRRAAPRSSLARKAKKELQRAK